ncbi:unnamed protein product, partial [Ectocarpus fasciculatus]
APRPPPVRLSGAGTLTTRETSIFLPTLKRPLSIGVASRTKTNDPPEPRLQCLQFKALPLRLRRSPTPPHLAPSPLHPLTCPPRRSLRRLRLSLSPPLPSLSLLPPPVPHLWPSPLRL